MVGGSREERQGLTGLGLGASGGGILHDVGDDDDDEELTMVTSRSKYAQD